MQLQGISPCTFSKPVGSSELTTETLEGGKRFEIKSLQRKGQKALHQAIAKDEQKGLECHPCEDSPKNGTVT